jgi:hypothetical protein
MMARLYAALVDGFGPEAGRELFEAAERSLERAARERAEGEEPEREEAPSIA